MCSMPAVSTWVLSRDLRDGINDLLYLDHGISKPSPGIVFALLSCILVMQFCLARQRRWHKHDHTVQHPFGGAIRI